MLASGNAQAKGKQQKTERRKPDKRETASQSKQFRVEVLKGLRLTSSEIIHRGLGIGV